MITIIQKEEEDEEEQKEQRRRRGRTRNRNNNNDNRYFSSSSKSHLSAREGPRKSTNVIVIARRSFPTSLRWKVSLLLSQPLVCQEDRLTGLVVKASASGAEDPGFQSRLNRGIFPGRVIPVTSKLALQWLPGIVGSASGLVGPVSVYCDWVR